ncbi:unnamed protein product [Rangifer tarandus platyrhynchus]|uniref:Uncharacterized protein n=1 Tax=Rangifer tarandus platyrhynchus TaxID=3082113 RepID=A0AC59Z4E1_RANTA
MLGSASVDQQDRYEHLRRKGMPVDQRSLIQEEEGSNAGSTDMPDLKVTGTDKLSELVPLDLSNGPLPDIDEKVIDRSRPFTMSPSRGISSDRRNRSRNEAGKFRTRDGLKEISAFERQDEMDKTGFCSPKSSDWLVIKPGPRSPSNYTRLTEAL